MNLKKDTVFVEIDGKKITFPIWHNLPDTFGLSLECAVENWAVRTDQYTVDSLCDYINSKDTGFIAKKEEK